MTADGAETEGGGAKEDAGRAGQDREETEMTHETAKREVRGRLGQKVAAGDQRGEANQDRKQEEIPGRVAADDQ